jgi:hypothetical protein
MKPLHPHEFLEYFFVPGYPGAYLLGCFSRHVTIYSQQVRGLNLIDALCRTGQLGAQTRVAVVGSGVAGLTAAAAALVRGAKVTLIEQRSDLCPIQSEAGERYLHPHIYDWPMPASNGGAAGLPLLNWAARAADVFDKLKKGWQAISQKLKADPPIFRTTLTGIDAGSGMLDLTLSCDGRESHHEAEIAVLAIGFGREESRADYQTYWQNSPLDSEQGTQLKWLVSGFGDGALTDLMRLSIPHFRHEKFVEAFAQDQELAEQLKNLLTSLPQGNSVRTTFDELYPRVKGKLAIEKRMDTQVVLNAPAEYLENPGSSILNRFIVYQLEKLGAFTRKAGKMVTPPPPQDAEGKYRIRFENPDDEEDFDRLVIRHGTRPALNEEALPELYHACRKLKVDWQDLVGTGAVDRTRTPIFDPADYAIETAPNAPTEAIDAFESHGELRYLVLESTSIRPSLPLRQLVRSAISGETYRTDIEVATGNKPAAKPVVEVIGINDALGTQARYSGTVRALCRADIAVIDVTGYEPGVMLFLGIRSSARRGVTIVTTNKQMDAAEWSVLPFNLKEMYPVSVALENNASELLGRLIARAYGQYTSMRHYQDLPAYEAARQTGKDYDPVDPALSILWLCSFNSRYTTKGYLEYLRTELGDTFAAGSRFERVTDIVSPQLVSQRLYGAIRFRKLCIVDWTFWSANVFYELGVRLAINKFGPVCLLATDPESESILTEDLIRQRNSLKKLFAPIEYDPETNRSPQEEVKARYHEMKNAELPRRRTPFPPAFGSFSYHHTFKRVAQYLSWSDESGAAGPYEFFNGLLDALLGAEGVSKPGSPVLFANDNDPYAKQIRMTATAIGIAAWHFMRYRYASDDLNASKSLMGQYQNIGDRLLALLQGSEDPREQKLAEEIDQVLAGLRPTKGAAS